MPGATVPQAALLKPVLPIAVVILASAVAFATVAALAADDNYDPLAVGPARPARKVELTLTSEKREIPIRIYLPAGTKPAPVVLFSHGLGGSREGNAFMGEHWAARGYVAVFLQHPGSDTSVWKDVPRAEAMRAMRSAASAKNLTLRIADVHATLDRLTAWNAEAGSPLKGRLDLSKVGMSGHSFGAVTTQAVSGQSLPLTTGELDKRIRAAILYSPSPPRAGSTKSAFAEVAIPWLLMTGTKDAAAIGGITAESRLEVFPALPPGGKYELVLDRAEHSAFTDRALPGDKEPRNPGHHRAILAISTAFWDAYLRDDPQARAWLDGAGAKSALETADRWQRK